MFKRHRRGTSWCRVKTALLVKNTLKFPRFGCSVHLDPFSLEKIGLGKSIFFINFVVTHTVIFMNKSVLFEMASGGAEE